MNDFDETHPGPWEWDVKRLAASITVAARSLGLPVIMIARPQLPERDRVESVDAVLAWLDHFNA